MQTNEKLIHPVNGFLFLFLSLGLLGLGIYMITMQTPSTVIGGILTILLSFFLMLGLLLINPNGSRVLVFFGKYVGTVKDNGLFWVNPLNMKKLVSLKASNLESERIKVNDKLGNPIMISTILVWKVKNTYKANFEVDNYAHFVKVQCDAAVRKLASLYPYDNFEDEGKAEAITLRSSVNEVSKALEAELEERLEMAGIEVLEARIGYLAYAEEIAGAMLKRQQATAVVAARHKIVEGAVSMVEMALNELGKKEIVLLDEERKAAMVSNLMVILCSDREATPVVNTGTLNP